MKNPKLYSSIAMFVALTFVFLIGNIPAQVNGNDRRMAIGMLGMTKDAIKNNYYDPAFHGVDIDFVFEQAKERMKTAPTRDALMMIIAQTVLAFDDSHTTFFPPSRAADIDYGWRVAMVGDDCFVTRIKPKSDAEAKGLKIGDKLLAIDGFKPTRKNLWQMYYRYFSIAPRAQVAMTLLSPGDEKPHTLEIQTKIEKSAGVITMQNLYEKLVVKEGVWDTGKTNRSIQFGNDLLVWKMEGFSTDEINIDSLIDKARNCKTLIVDLRDNGGGSVEILRRLTGYFFDKDIKLGDEKRRKETKPLIAKSRGGGVFKGNLIVLVNHSSASASELFSRIIQLEKRGKVIGDKTAGAVMESKFHPMGSGIGNSLWFGASVTMADLIMTDGQSLEKVGVTPDEIMLPTGRDLAGSQDPVLSYAAKLAGVELSPEKAGKLFPFEWPK
jgi:carboxyl-terminal processing protease